MSYQVLARRYRPANFQELEGQEHVLQALINALDNGRLHHAYLFTGTRGVGKTTIARILAKCLNCEKGISATPCGECPSCLEIAEGRSVDLIEVDAASRTGVDDMRELLENVQYMPTSSRFKIYLIDEVHMLSRSSFNAMLKTLEEPPEHVKFLFATTDPKKLPITVLSRCLQFNLKNLSPEQIVYHLDHVLKVESIPCDESALWQLGHAADGSMRDALSLTDQAISFGNNEVRDEQVRSMLGAIDQREVYELIDAVAAEDGARLLHKVAALAEFAPDYAALLNDILSVLHRVAVTHAVPEAVDNSQGDRELVLATAKLISAEQVQLFYQIGLIGQRDLPLAPIPRVGFEMVLLRMMSFVPHEAGNTSSGDESAEVPTGVPGSEVSAASPIAGILDAINGESPSPVPSVEKPGADAVAEPQPEQPETAAPLRDQHHSKEIPQREGESAPPVAAADEEAPALAPDNWAEILTRLALTGVAGTLAANCQLSAVDGNECKLKLNEHHASLWNASYEQRIAVALSDLYRKDIAVSIEVGFTDTETPAEENERRLKENKAQAVVDIESDRNVQQLIESFNGKLDPDSISPMSR